MIAAFTGVLCTAVTLLPSFQSPHFRPLRAALFIGLGLWGVVPAIHGWRLHAHVPAVNAAIRLDVLMGVIYLASPSLYFLQLQYRQMTIHVVPDLPMPLSDLCKMSCACTHVDVQQKSAASGLSMQPCNALLAHGAA